MFTNPKNFLMFFFFLSCCFPTQANDKFDAFGIEFDDLYIAWLHHPEYCHKRFTDEKGYLLASSIYQVYSVDQKGVIDFIDICNAEDSYEDGSIETTTNLFIIIAFHNKIPVLVIIPNFGGYTLGFKPNQMDFPPSWSKKGASRLLLWSMRVLNKKKVINSIQIDKIKAPCIE